MHTLTVLGDVLIQDEFFSDMEMYLRHGILCDEGKAHTESLNCDSGLGDILQPFQRVSRQRC